MPSDHESFPRHILLACIATGPLVLVFTQPPFGQALDYHHYADQRELPGAPNFFDVILNLTHDLVGGHTLKHQLAASGGGCHPADAEQQDELAITAA